MIDEPIILSLLDDDLYKYTMGQVAFHLFPKAKVEYQFINRGGTVFPDGFGAELTRQIRYLSNLSLTPEEVSFLHTISFIRPTYIEWLAGYKMNPDEVEITHWNGTLSIKIKGYWYRTIFWEVKLMAIISELYFKMTNQPMDADWKMKINTKANQLSDATLSLD